MLVVDHHLCLPADSLAHHLLAVGNLNGLPRSRHHQKAEEGHHRFLDEGVGVMAGKQSRRRASSSKETSLNLTHKRNKV
jgi:hypothetical protein